MPFRLCCPMPGPTIPVRGARDPQNRSISAAPTKRLKQALWQHGKPAPRGALARYSMYSTHCHSATSSFRCGDLEIGTIHRLRLRAGTMLRQLSCLLGILSSVHALNIVPGKGFDRIINIWLENQVRCVPACAEALAGDIASSVLTRATSLSVGLRQGLRRRAHSRSVVCGHLAHALLCPNTPEPAQLRRCRRGGLFRSQPRQRCSYTRKCLNRGRPPRRQEDIVAGLL